MRIRVPLVCLVLLIAGTAEAARACVCADQVLNDRENVARQFAEATVVFEGEVLPGGREISAPSRDEPGLSMIVFRVLRAYKGNPEESIPLYDAMAGSDCSFGQPKPGEKFFVYGFKGKDIKIYLEACTRTQPLDSAGPDIRYARGEPATQEDLTPPGERWRLLIDPSLATRGATVHGTIRRADRADVSNVFVTIWDVDERGRRETSMAATQKVNADGTYNVRFLPPGRYRLTALDYDFKPAVRFVGEFGNISLSKGQTLSSVDVLLNPEPLGKVSIRVVAAPPELHDRLLVWLRDAQMDALGGPPYPYAQTAELDEENVASFEFVPYGLYDVYVMLTGEDVSKPSWTHDKVQVQLNGSHSETVVQLRKNDLE